MRKLVVFAIIFLPIFGHSTPLDIGGPEQSFRPEPISFVQFQERVSANPGNILVVDLWATWCKPCRDRFPIIHKLQIKYSLQDVEFITLSFDDPGDPEALVLAERFLREQQAQYPHFIMKDPMALAFHFLELEALPAVLIYDRSRENLKKVLATVPTMQLNSRVSRSIEDWLLTEKHAKQ